MVFYQFLFGTLLHVFDLILWSKYLDATWLEFRLFNSWYAEGFYDGESVYGGNMYVLRMVNKEKRTER